jgi:thiamine pyrophosphokinase
MPAEESQNPAIPNSSPPEEFLHLPRILIKVKHITIFANGDIFQNQIKLPEKTTVIAADGGARHCLDLGIKPDVVIGDFDSLTASDITTLKTLGAEVDQHPEDKDETDLELALNHAVTLGAQQITLYGLLGGRLDMSFANLLLLGSPRYAEISFQVSSGNTQAYILRSGETLELRGLPGDTVSAIPLKESINGLTYDGLRWPLVDASLSFGTPQGVSNTMTSNKARIYLTDGLLLIFHIRHK